jgi:hypothetical protein
MGNNVESKNAIYGAIGANVVIASSSVTYKALA